MKWDDYSDQAAPFRKYRIFVIFLIWMKRVCICTSCLRSSSCLISVSFSYLQRWTEVSVKTLGRRPHLLCPAHQEGDPRLYPLPASTPTSPSEFDSRLSSEAAGLPFYSSAGQVCVSEQVDLLSADVTANIANGRVLLKRACRCLLPLICVPLMNSSRICIRKYECWNANNFKPMNIDGLKKALSTSSPALLLTCYVLFIDLQPYLGPYELSKPPWVVFS